MITIHNLRKNFGTQTAVDIENYTINQGEMVGLVGNNGAGKTTLFRSCEPKRRLEKFYRCIYR